VIIVFSMFFAPCLDIAASMPLFAVQSHHRVHQQTLIVGTPSLVSYFRVSVRPWCQSWRQVVIPSVTVAVCRIVDQVRP
jgi:hypothetical protein